MPLTLNQFLLLILTLAAVVLVTILAMFFIQLRRTAREGAKTLEEIRELAREVRGTNEKIQARLDDSGETIEAVKKAAGGVADIVQFLTLKMVRPSSKYWPLIFPLLKFGWRQMKRKKHKEE